MRRITKLNAADRPGGGLHFALTGLGDQQQREPSQTNGNLAKAGNPSERSRIMKRILMIGVALAAIVDINPANAGVKLQDVQSAGYICENEYNRNQHASVFFDTQEGKVYFQINAGHILQEPIETWWSMPTQSLNEYGHMVSGPPYNLSMVWWGTRFHAINAKQPSEFPGATGRMFDLDKGRFTLAIGVWNNGLRTENGGFYGDCASNYDKAEKLKEDYESDDAKAEAPKVKAEAPKVKATNVDKNTADWLNGMTTKSQN
jgi:hypothetical protein